jgi:FixJ family two-component response regulator
MADVTPIVFVVDDDVAVRESLQLLIRCEGWQPRAFASAQEFFARPPALVPNCLILDVSLAGLDGLDVQKRVSIERPEMPVIFIMGHGDVRTTVQAMKAGASEFLTKPFRDDVMVSAIREALERSRVVPGHENEGRFARPLGKNGWAARPRPGPEILNSFQFVSSLVREIQYPRGSKFSLYKYKGRGGSDDSDAGLG